MRAALGLLDTEITRFPGRPDLEGREQPHAPGYGYALGALCAIRKAGSPAAN